MIIIDLKNIVFKADFYPIQMGQSVSSLIKILGQPINQRIDDYGFALLSYGGYEFHFFDDQLHFFQNDNLKYDKSNHLDCIAFQNEYFQINPS